MNEHQRHRADQSLVMIERGNGFIKGLMIGDQHGKPCKPTKMAREYVGTSKVSKCRTCTLPQPSSRMLNHLVAMARGPKAAPAQDLRCQNFPCRSLRGVLLVTQSVTVSSFGVKLFHWSQSPTNNQQLRRTTQVNWNTQPISNSNLWQQGQPGMPQMSLVSQEFMAWEYPTKHNQAPSSLAAWCLLAR